MIGHSIDIQKNQIIYTTMTIMMKIQVGPTNPDIALTKIAMNSPVVINKESVSSLLPQVPGVVQPQMTLSLGMSICKQAIRNLARKAILLKV